MSPALGAAIGRERIPRPVAAHRPERPAGALPREVPRHAASGLRCAAAPRESTRGARVEWLAWVPWLEIQSASNSPQARSRDHELLRSPRRFPATAGATAQMTTGATAQTTSGATTPEHSAAKTGWPAASSAAAAPASSAALLGMSRPARGAPQRGVPHQMATQAENLHRSAAPRSREALWREATLVPGQAPTAVDLRA